MQRFYGIDLDHAHESHSAGHVAALAAHFPHGQSALYAAVDPDAGWTRAEILLAAIENNFAYMRWGMASKKDRGPAPKLVGPSWMTQGKMRKLQARTMSIEELMEQLSKPRR